MGKTSMPRILIVEDNEKNLKLFQLILDSRGYETVIARDGVEGVSLAKSSNPDIILMDIQMPKLNGAEALKLLKNDEQTCNIPVIAATAYSMKGDKQRLLDLGFSDYIAKPIHVDEFLGLIERKLNKNGLN
jgi:two-component system cell cycle response regulator DivK